MTSPRGARTRAHQRPSVTSPSSTPWWRHSCASQSTGVAAHVERNAGGRLLSGVAEQAEQPDVGGLDLAGLERRRFFAVPDAERLPALWKRSEDSQEDLTEALGVQVRQAVELLVTAIGRADTTVQGESLRGRRTSAARSPKRPQHDDG